MTTQPVLKFTMTVKGLLNLAFGIGLMAVPTLVFGFYGLTLDASGAFLSRILGATLFGTGLIQFLGRKSAPGPLQTLMVGAIAAAEFAGLAMATQAVTAGLLNVAGWSLVAGYAFAVCGFGYAFLKECASGRHSPV